MWSKKAMGIDGKYELRTNMADYRLTQTISSMQWATESIVKNGEFDIPCS